MDRQRQLRTVGVMGDERTDDHACALRLVTATERMTAGRFTFDPDFPARVANRIVNAVRGINGGLRRDAQAARDDRVGVS